MAKQVVSDINFAGNTTCLAPVAPTEVAHKQFVEETVAAGLAFPFWDASNTQVCITMTGGLFPFWDASNVQANIPLGC